MGLYHICFLFVMSFFLTSCFSAPIYKGPTSDHFNGETFFNPTPIEHKFWNIIKWQMTSHKTPWPSHIPVTQTKPPQLDKGKLGVTYIGHATTLVQLDGVAILTDPVWSDRVSPVSWAGPKRVRDAGVLMRDLPKIDVIVISHNHYDHMDLATIKEIFEKDHPLILVGLGNDLLLKENGIESQAMDWWESVTVNGVFITFTPAQHWSGRGLTDRSKTLWGSFYMKDRLGTSIYFAGDTAYASHFKNIADRLGPPTYALLPIGAYEPRWFMQRAHMSPEDAVLAHIDLGAHRSIGIHFGTFQLSDEGVDQPIKDLENAKIKNGLQEMSFLTIPFGETRSF